MKKFCHKTRQIARDWLLSSTNRAVPIYLELLRALPLWSINYCYYEANFPFCISLGNTTDLATPANWPLLLMN